MCRFICKFYDCRCQVYIVTSFCQRYFKTGGHICNAKTHVYREECHPGEVCPSHRSSKHTKTLYKNLNKTHTDRNWKVMKTTAATTSTPTSASPRAATSASPRRSPLVKQTGFVG